MSIENAYDYFNDGTCNVPNGYEVVNAYGAFFKAPLVGTRKVAIYGDNFLTGYLNTIPPVNGGFIKGYLGLGQTSAVCQLDVSGTIRATGQVSISETVSTNTELSSTKDSILDSRNSSLTVTLPNATLVDQIKLVKLLSRGSLSSTVSCGRGSFKLNSNESSRLLRFTTDGWVVDNAYGQNISDSFYTTTETSKVLSSSIPTAGSFGSSAAISGDGLTVVIGAPVEGQSVGAAWVFVRSAGSTSWTLEQKLVGTGNTGGSQQGNSVAISANGNTIVIGGPADNSNIGALWVFRRVAGVWTQDGSKITGSGRTGSPNLGFSVAISADGETIAAGGPTDDTNIGAVWVFYNNGGTWWQFNTKIVGSGNTGESKQGWSVAISADGNIVAFGGPGDDTNTGAVWVFYKNGGVYDSQSGILVGTGFNGEARIGRSISLSADGTTLATGGNEDSGNIGAVWVFNRVGVSWSQQGSKLVGSGRTGSSQQGWSVSLTADGNTLAEYGYSDNSNAGSVWSWTRNNSSWTQQSRVVPSSGGTFGGAVALNSNGTSMLVTNVEFSENTGKFYIFT